MAIRTFNSVGGYSVGETPDTIIYSNGDIITANATFTTNLDVGTLLAGNGNITVGNAIVAGNVLTDHLKHIDGTPWDFATASGDAGWVQYSNGTDLVASGNFVYVDSATLTGMSTLRIGSNASNAQVTIGTSTDKTVITNGNISATGNININTGNIILYQNGNIYSSGAANLAGGNVTIAANGTTNIGSGNVIITPTGNISGTGNLTIANITANSNVFIGNSTSNVTITNGNVSATNTLTSANVVANNNANIGNTLYVGNNTSNVTIANGNVTTTGNIQVGTGSSNVIITDTGNITATGTIAANTITFSGNIQAPGSNTYIVFNDQGNLNAVSGFTFDKTSNTLSIGGSGGDLTLTGGNISGANNISANSLTLANDAVVNGNLYVAGTTTYVNTSELIVQDPIIQLGGGANGAPLVTNDGKDRGTLLHYYVGASGSGTAVDAFMGWDNSNSAFIFGSDVSYNPTGQIVTVNTYGNIVAGNANLGNLTTSNFFAGVFEAGSSSQPNIHSVGTLEGLTANSTVNFASASNVSLGPIGNVHITGGDSGQIIATDGTGNLYWTSSPQVTEIQHGTSNVSIPVSDGNINLTAGGNTTLVVTSTGANVSGTLNVTGNVVLGNTTANSYTVGDTSIKAATITTTSTSLATIANVETNGTSIRGIEFFIKGEDSTGNKYRVATVTAVHDGSNVEYTEVTVVTTNGSPGVLSVTMSGTVISLKTTPSSSNSTKWTTQYRTI